MNWITTVLSEGTLAMYLIESKMSASLEKDADEETYPRWPRGEVNVERILRPVLEDKLSQRGQRDTENVRNSSPGMAEVHDEGLP